MWSAGVTAYVLLTGFSPFGGETDQETFCNVARAQLDFPEELFDGVSAHATAFVRALLERDPSARPSAAEGLRHPWLQGTRQGRGAAGRRRGRGRRRGGGGRRQARAGRFLSSRGRRWRSAGWPGGAGRCGARPLSQS
ncbi:Death-associated protein kinase related, partial [Gryllus bimaculatus]